MKLQIQNGVVFLQSDLFLKYNIPHAFTAKRGGISVNDFESLNVSTRRKDSEGNFDKYENTVENFKRVCSLVGATPEKSVCAHQTHGNTVLKLDKSFCGMGILKTAQKNIDADGLYINGESQIEAICVKSADCTPILLADKQTDSVCAIHSGWRGTVSDIVGNAIKTMTQNGALKENIICAIGPCIGVCCYEVGENVYFEAHKTLKERNAENSITQFFTDKRTTENGIKYNFNMGKMCAFLAYYSGIREENIDFLNVCTQCTSDRNGRIFFSHRGQNGHSGTQASIIAPPKRTERKKQ